MHFASYYRWLVYQHLFGQPKALTNLLDIGTDDGGFIARLQAEQSVALERSLPSLRRVSQGHRVCADGTAVPFENATFDHVLLSDVIEHVENDHALVREATRVVKQGGTLWLSTTATDFALFPAFITSRAERSWGHVRKGYDPKKLVALIGEDFNCHFVIWPEVVFRRLYLLTWLCASTLPWIAQRLVHFSFRLDRNLMDFEPHKGHIYICATHVGAESG
jgi:SAM-dependent methyltransferase